MTEGCRLASIHVEAFETVKQISAAQLSIAFANNEVSAA